MAKLVGILYSKETILEQIQDCVNSVSANCFYCMAAAISDDEMLGEKLKTNEEKALYENLKTMLMF